MRRRLYFMVPDTRSARQIRDELLLARIEDGHIHVMARDGMSLDGLHEDARFHLVELGEMRAEHDLLPAAGGRSGA